MRPYWNGYLKLALVSCPIALHAACSHIYSCKRFAAFLERSPDTATLEDIRLFQLHLAETGMSICNRNRIIQRAVGP